MKRFILCCVLLLQSILSVAYTRQDTLRGSNGRGRDWWDVMKYDLNIQIDTAAKSITGTNVITFRVTGEPRDSMQIDLQEGLDIRQPDSESPFPPKYRVVREGNVCWIIKPSGVYQVGKQYNIFFEFYGKPKAAVHPPWDGGFIWAKDSAGKPWIAVACQGLGASSWWPCKDYQGDEPDSGMRFWINNPNHFTNAAKVNLYTIISNGRFFDGNSIIVEDPVAGTTSTVFSQTVFSWKTKNPINTYNTTFYIGDYAHWQDTFHGEKGILDIDFYPLRYNERKARKHWAVTKEMLRCFEWWMGPYPFYEDGYKLVEAPYLGMEHQSAVAYGNQYTMGYLGRDRSGSGNGVGLSFDFIIIHESGHEWFGNSITAKDIADNWLHEGFGTYTETLFAEWIKGRNAAFDYARGEWQNIRNDRPVVGDYGVNDAGSSDKYDKGAAVVHMIRLMLHDDERFRQLLRGLNRDFYHRIVTSKEVEDYISKAVGRDLKPFFDQYLRSKEPPLVYKKLQGNKLTLQIMNNEMLKIPVYNEQGRFICELSKMPVTISQKDLPALQNYYILYKL